MKSAAPVTTYRIAENARRHGGPAEPPHRSGGRRATTNKMSPIPRSGRCASIRLNVLRNRSEEPTNEKRNVRVRTMLSPASSRSRVKRLLVKCECGKLISTRDRRFPRIQDVVQRGALSSRVMRAHVLSVVRMSVPPGESTLASSRMPAEGSSKCSIT